MKKPGNRKGIKVKPLCPKCNSELYRILVVKGGYRHMEPRCGCSLE